MESNCVILGFSAGKKIIIVALFFSSVFSFVVFVGVGETQKVIHRKNFRRAARGRVGRSIGPTRIFAALRAAVGRSVGPDRVGIRQKPTDGSVGRGRSTNNLLRTA